MSRFRGLVALFGLGMLVSPAAADDSTKTTQAKQLYLQGVDLTEWGQFREAIVAFEKSQALVPRAKTVYQIATCERLLGLLTRARRDYRRALAFNAATDGTDIPKEVVSDVQALLTVLEKRIARVHVTVVPEHAAVAVDGAPLEIAGLFDGESVLVAHTQPSGPGAWTPVGPFVVELDPGTHVFLVSAPGYTASGQSVTVETGQVTSTTITLSAAPVAVTASPALVASGSGRRVTLGFVFAGASVALLGSGVYFGLRALRRDDEAASHCLRGFCDAEGMTLGADARRSARIADFAIGFGLASAALSTYLFVSSTRVAVQPVVGASGGGLALTGVW